MDNYKSELGKQLEQSDKIKTELLRYFSFWPYILLTILMSIVIGFLIIRYSNPKYVSSAVIEIIDKSQDSEMALPTSMTIFNRSMINLDNEIGRLTSYNIHKNVVAKLNSNIKFYHVGNINKVPITIDEMFKDLKFELLIDAQSINKLNTFKLIVNQKLEIQLFEDDQLIKTYEFDDYSTYDVAHDLPFNISFNYDFKENFETEKEIWFDDFNQTVNFYRNNVKIKEIAPESDQLLLELVSSNKEIANEYLNFLINEFDLDGVKDRQLEYKRTIEFVDTRSLILLEEVSRIENRRQKYKEENNFTNLNQSSEIRSGQTLSFDTEIFNISNQIELIDLINEIKQDEGYFDLIPVNIGIDDPSIVKIITEYNQLSRSRNKYIQSAGPNNSLIKNLESELEKIKLNLDVSIDSYKKSLKLSLQNLQTKENEISELFNKIPLNEKILRSIERELEIKEALYLLLLQKREEAAINFAVVKPSIKIIDYARSPIEPISPKKFDIITLCIIIGFTFPIFVIFIWFSLNTKVHTKNDIEANLPNISFAGEVPYMKKINFNFNTSVNTRNTILESLRIVLANLLFTKKNVEKNNCHVVLVTSSIKSEGKTLISSHLSKIVTSQFKKVLLIGADLRNPQLHKFTDFDKARAGLSDLLHRDDLKVDDIVLKYESLDVILSGVIPPNPIQLLSSSKFKNLLSDLKNKYDFIIIDSAPCLLVADTFQISDLVDYTLLVTRANHTEKIILDYVRELNEKGRLNNVNIVLNSVGNSRAYGYQYGYQYGYNYSYSYNYGYGYGYAEDSD